MTDRMRLTDLNPKLEGSYTNGVLRLDCPLRHAHKIRVPLGDGRWNATGRYPETLTVRPSINCDKLDKDGKFLCGWHGHITNGDVE
jgi:hypothetical protein